MKTMLENKQLAGKYMGFNLDAETYGLEILKVQEIIGLMNITAVPRTPDFVRGVVNLRGKVIPVVDLRLKFAMAAVEDTERTCIIVVEVDMNDTVVTMGVIVDQVSEVMDIASESAEPPPSFGSPESERFLLGIGKFQEEVVLLLNLEQILTESEMTVICAVGEDE